MNERESGRGGGEGEQSASQPQSNLTVSKESCKIRKPPPPVVIYMVPPKVIHAEASEFMAVVQRLTGSNHEEKQEEDRGQLGEGYDGNSHLLSSRETRGREEGKKDYLASGVVEDYHELNFMSLEQEDGIRGVRDAGGSSFFDAFSKKD